MSFKIFIFLMLSCSSFNANEYRCQLNSSIYSIGTEWTSTETCQTCKCLANEISICRNRTCQIPKDCQMGEQLTLNAGTCCPTCSSVRRSCLYDSTAILVCDEHNTIFYPKSCLQCRCRDGQLFCDDICRQSILQNKCSFHNELYNINAVWSPLACVICQCREIPETSRVSPVCYIKQCSTLTNCSGPVEFLPGQCCPVCRAKICRENNDLIYQNGDVWTRNDNCTHCACKNGSIVCTDEICPILQCQSNEKPVRLPNTCCSICSNRHMCRFYGNKGYQIYYEHDLWYTSACQYCTCRRHNRIICKSIQCEHQFCLEDEIQEARSDSCCVSCRQAKQCNIHGQTLKEGSYHQMDNCTLCTCTSERQPDCYSNCHDKGYAIMKLKASSLRRNHTITITDSLATIIAYSKLGAIIPSKKEARSLLFQFSSPIATMIKSNVAVLLGIIHNSTGQISHRLILIHFDSITNNTKTNHTLAGELRLWMPLTLSTQRTNQSSVSFIEEEKTSEQVILIVFIIILSLVCFILILIIMFLCHRRKAKTIEPTLSMTTFKRANSSLSMVEKFQAPDLTSKVTLLTHFHLTELDFGTDV